MKGVLGQSIAPVGVKATLERSISTPR
jgi:hypothetical protein